MVLFALARGFWMFALANVLGGFAIACTSGCESAQNKAIQPTPCCVWPQPAASSWDSRPAVSLLGCRCSAQSLSLIGIVLNLWIGSLGDQGLPTTGLGMGMSLVLLCVLVPFVVKRPMAKT
jgi:hypothetical protein